MAVYSRIVTKETDAKDVSQVILGRTRAAGYKGAPRVREDRMVILGRDTAEVMEPQPPDRLRPLDTKGQAFP
jgi:hypothetical protein